MVTKMYSATEVATILGVTKATVREWLKTEKLKGVKPTGQWRVSETELKRFLEEKHGAAD